MRKLTGIVGALVLVGLGFGAATWLQSRQAVVPAPAPASAAAPAAPPALVDAVRFDAGASQLTSIRVEPVVEARVPLAEPLNARLAYNENVTARVSTPISGRVTALKLQPGDPVKAGDALLSIDSPDLALAVADQQKARADETRKRLALERTSKLVEAGVVPRKELDNAQGDMAQARAESERAQRRLRNLAPRGTDSGSFVLRSPISGVIVDRKVNPGSEVRPDTAEPLFVISDPRQLWVLVDMPERDLSKVQVGHRALVEVDAYPNQNFDARIERIAEIVDPTTRRVQVRAALDNSERRLKPEMYARVTLLADDNVLAVRIPNSAIVTQGLYSYAFVETEPGLFRRRKIELTVQDREYGYVSSGIARGERLVTTGALLLNSELATTIK